MTSSKGAADRMSLPTGTVTVLAAGVDSDTRPLGADHDAADDPAARLSQAVTDAVATHRGVRVAEPGSPDGFAIAFSYASDAVACALTLQRAPLTSTRLRIGLHTAETSAHDDGDHIDPVLRRAALLTNLAHPGQTLLSRVTEQLVADRLPGGGWLADLGSHPLPGLPHPERVAQLCHADVHGALPPLRASEPAVHGRVPAQLTSFIGRQTELTEVHRLVDEHRLVTLSGPGGVGKSRLAVRLATGLLDDFAAGVWWVDLAPITEPSLVVVAVARTLELQDHPGRSTTDTLIRFIAARPVLIVLDNCEHLLDACITLAVTLLEACPELKLVTTSREPLGVIGEVTWHTPSLSLSDEAVELFTDRARLVRPDFAVAEENAAAVAEICRRLDGVPLAIELAAARVRALSLTEIVDGLHDRFRLLTGGARAAVPRQQTLRASVDWSHALLSEPERVLFRRLAVFRGGFDLDAAHAVAGDADAMRYQTLDELSLLVSKSLVGADDTGQTMRYRLLETVREYALEKLDESGEVALIRTRHCDHYTALAELLEASGGRDQRQHAEHAVVEINNFRAAFAWSRENTDISHALQLASSLQPLWLQGRVLEGLAWFDAVLTDDPAVAPAARARGLADKVILEAFTGVFFLLDQTEPALAIARGLDDPALLARVLAACGATNAFDIDAARPYFEEAIGLARRLGDDWRLSQILGWRALAAYLAGDPITACAAGDEGRNLADTIGDGFISRMCRWSTALALWMKADLEAALTQFRDVVADSEAANDPLWRAYGWFGVGKTLAYQGDAQGAQAAAEAGIEVAADVTGVQQALNLGSLADAALAAGDAAAAVAASTSAWQTGPLHYLLGSNAYPMAQAALAAGDVTGARRWADDGVSAAPAGGGHQMIMLAARTRVAIAQDDLAQACRDAYDALSIAAETTAYLTIPDVIECLAGLAVDSAAHRDAVRLLGAAQAIRDRTGQVRFAVYDGTHDATVRALREAMGDADFDDGWAEGYQLSSADAVSRALRGRGARNRPISGWGSLTPTELDVVRLVSQGLANKEIAARLFVSPRTVQTHLTHIYAKLGLSSRVQLAREATHQVDCAQRPSA